MAKDNLGNFFIYKSTKRYLMLVKIFVKNISEKIQNSF